MVNVVQQLHRLRCFKQIKEATEMTHLEVFETVMETSCLYLKYARRVVDLTTKSQLKFVQNVVQHLDSLAGNYRPSW